MDDDIAFFEKLDRALRPLLGSQYLEFYRRASKLLEEFRSATGLSVNKVTPEEFTAAAFSKAQGSPAPHPADERSFARSYLPILLRGPADLDINVAIAKWIDEKVGTSAAAPSTIPPAEAQ